MNNNEFWTSIGKSACPDDIARDLSIDAIKKNLPKKTKKLLDLGWSDGYCSLKLSSLNIEEIVGFDYSKKSIENANKNLKLISNFLSSSTNYSFFEESALDLSKYREQFDAVITIRCLINVGNIDAQIRALNEIYNTLSNNGTYLMCENFLSGLNLINEFRNSIGIPSIEQRWHNNYLDDEIIMPEINNLFDLKAIDHFNSSYFFVSRVVNAWLAKEDNREPDYNDPLNHMAAKLPAFGNFSPMRLLVLQKK